MHQTITHTDTCKHENKPSQTDIVRKRARRALEEEKKTKTRIRRKSSEHFYNGNDYIHTVFLVATYCLHIRIVRPTLKVAASIECSSL